MTRDLDASAESSKILTDRERSAAQTSDYSDENWINGRYVADHELPDAGDWA